jgi:non-heme chloroperoxidase
MAASRAAHYAEHMPQLAMRDGQTLHVRVLGRGTPCVLVHGFASDGASWLPFIAPLARRYRFIIPDLRGFGMSKRSTLPEACPLNSYADDLGALAEALDLRDAPLVGISMGALSAVRCFERGHASRFARYLHIDQGLVIHNHADSAHGLLGGAQPGFFQSVRGLLAELETIPHRDFHRLPALLRAELARVFAQFAEAAFTHPGVRRLVHRLTRSPRLLPLFLPPEGFATHVQIMRAYLDRAYDLRAAFAEIRVPTTVLIGAASRMYPVEGQRWVKTLGVEVRELAGVGHMLPLEAPRRFVRELSSFLEA